MEDDKTNNNKNQFFFTYYGEYDENDVEYMTGSGSIEKDRDRLHSDNNCSDYGGQDQLNGKYRVNLPYKRPS